MTAEPECLIQSPVPDRHLTQSPAKHTDRPTDTVTRVADPLSAVLRAVRLRGAVYFLVDASPPWVARAPQGRVLAPVLMPGAQHLIEYHIVRRGSCYGGLLGQPMIELRAGDVIVFTQGDAHVMSSSPTTRVPDRIDTHDVDQLLRRSSPPFPVRTGSRGAPSAEVVCGFLGCDIRPFNPLISTLPRVLCVRADEGSEQLHALIALTLAECAEPCPGGECTLARLSELMFIEVVRRHLSSLPPGREGWLAGLRDAYVGRALSLLHGEPGHDWTLESLARAVGLSRSALADRFKQFTGQPPMQYLAQWRMQIAAGMLAEGNANIAAVAFDVGYGSEAAFSRAFKKLVGMAPSAWRDHGNAPETPVAGT